MIIKLKNDIGPEQKERLLQVLRREGIAFTDVSPERGPIIVAEGKLGQEADFLRQLAGVEEVIPDKVPCRLALRRERPEGTVVQVGPVAIGAERLAVIAGPCAIESREQAFAIAREVRRYGATLYRGGAFKPRSSPYSFQGLGEEGLKILAEVREETGMPVVSEIVSPAYVDLMLKYVDMLQVGARNMQNFELLKCVGRVNKPVLLKRGLSATIEEWLMSAEYILAEGNAQVVLCERGIRTFEPYTRNTLDLSAIPVLKKLTHLPVIIDPSHATGLREKVAPLARAAVAVGADGLMVEVHHRPEEAMSDGPQALWPMQFGQLMREIYVIAPVVHKQVDFAYLDKASEIERKADSEASDEPQAVFFGELGTAAHRACKEYFGAGVKPVPAASCRAVFDRGEESETAYGVIPLQNSLTGSVHENYDLLLEHDLKIVGEIALRIVHNLVAPPGTRPASVKRVLSDPDTFRQCRDYLDRHPEWELVTVQDPAAAAKRISEKGPAGDAAITGHEAAELYGLDVLEEGIEANPRNYTRFAIVGHERLARGTGQKSSLIYQTANRPGALFETLRVFAERDINLVKLESRPLESQPWEWMFYVDVEADAESPQFQPVLDELKEHIHFLKILGAY